MLYLIKEVFDREVYYFRTSRDAPLVLDCGANIGVAALYIKRLYPHARIVCYEPFPEAFAALCANVESNGLRQIELHQLALAPTAGEAELHFDAEHLGSLSMSLRPERIRGASHVVETTRLSDAITGHVDLLKMDIEGVEFEVLAEAAERGKLRLVDQIIVEYHHHITETEDRLAGLLDLLEREGFGYRIRAKYRPRAEPTEFQDILLHAYRRSRDT